MICDYIKLFTPYVFYGNNKTHDFVSKIMYPEGVTLESESDLFLIEINEDTGDYELYLNDCSLLYSGNCKCKPNELRVRWSDGEDTGVCYLKVYTVQMSNVVNGVSQVGTYPELTLNVSNLPILDENFNTPCDVCTEEEFNEHPERCYNPATAYPLFSVLLIDKSETIKAEHSSFETRFCQMFYNSIKISRMYKASELFNVGDELVIKIRKISTREVEVPDDSSCTPGAKTVVEEYEDYEIHDTTTYPDGSVHPITVRYVQKDNTLTLDMAVDFTLPLCDNDFIVETKKRDVCNEIPQDVLKICDNGTVKFVLDPAYIPVDTSGNEVCGKMTVALNIGGCEAFQNNSSATMIDIIRYQYDGGKVDGKYTTGTQCIYGTPIELNYEQTDGDGPIDSNSVYGKTMYVKVKDPSICCDVVYNRVRTKYNRRLSYRHGEMTLNGLYCRENDIVWLAAQYNDEYDADGNRIDGNGLWKVKRGYWVFLTEVDNSTFIDLGARVIDTVQTTISTPVSRLYGNYWVNGKFLSSGSVVNIINQEDSSLNGLWRVMCGDWQYIGSAGPTSGDNIDASDKIVTYNDIDFCKCGVYHIWYYYLNNACVLNTAMRTVKVVGKCNGLDGTLVPGNRIRITDYYIQTEVDKELQPGGGGDPYIDPCLKRVETFEDKYRVDVNDNSDNCFGPVISPDCTEVFVCDHTYRLKHQDNGDMYSSSNNSGFSLVFWKYENQEWKFYALVGETNKKPKNYLVYSLDVDGRATTSNVKIDGWYTKSLGQFRYASAVDVVDGVVPNRNLGVAKFNYSEESGVVVNVGDLVRFFDPSKNYYINGVKIDISTGYMFDSKMNLFPIDYSDSRITPAPYIGKITEINGTEIIVEFDDVDEIESDVLNAMLNNYTATIPDVEIHDPSWVFSDSIELDAVVVSDTYNAVGRQSIGEVKFDSNVVSLHVGDKIDTYSPELIGYHIQGIVDEIIPLEDSEDYDYKARIVFAAVVPKRKDTENYVKLKYVANNSLDSKHVYENWAIYSGSTQMFIPKSYEFRYYHTAISVDEFVDMYNSYGAWNCIQPGVKYIVLGDDDDYPIVTDDEEYIDLTDEYE